MSGENNAPADPCAPHHLLIQADLDGELDVAASATLAAHVAGCTKCAALRDELAQLSTRLRSELPRHAAPDALRDRLMQGAAVVRMPTAANRTKQRRILAIGSFGAGAAIAATLLLLLLPPRDDVDSELVSLHLRALQPGHLMDVVSTDQHTVKPWFDGRIDFAPTVKDLAASGFPLVGGRLDALGGRPVAALVYSHGKHLIDVVVEPGASPDAGSVSRQGYSIVSWTSDGLSYRAVSDVAAADLDQFVRLWHAAP
jgi:anti-sigma factor RsiW